MATLFGENLKIIRQERRISQDDLAKHLRVSRKTVSHWETGYSEPSIDQLRAMAKFFEVTCDELING